MLQLEDQTTNAAGGSDSPQHQAKHGPAFSIGALLGIICLIALAVCVAIVPSKIKTSIGGHGAEIRARARLRELIQEDLAEDTPQESMELDPEKPKQLHTDNIVFGNKVAEPESEDLRFGRWLMSRNKTEAAIPYLQKYLQLDPDRISVRLELIDAYIKTKRMLDARLMCIRTFKKQLKDADNAAVWQRLSQCQTN